MDLVGELVVTKTRLAQSAQDLAARLGDDPLARRADEDAQQFARIAGQVQDQVTGLRMLPIDTVFNRFPRVVRDIDSQLHKEVRLVIEGKETELDRSVLEVVGDPISHLVRNALDHGIESPEERRALGKSLPATVRLSARHADGRILITVEDDGRGMDPVALRLAAVEKGVMSSEAAAGMTDAEALRVIFAPGFSTSKFVSEVSGRGVGLDVVRNNIEKLGGWVDVSSVPGTGTCISLSLPLTLAIIGALLVRSGPRVCALPLTGVVETLRADPASLGRVRGHDVLTLRDRVIPVERLDSALGDPPMPLQTDERGFVNLVVVHSQERRDGTGRGCLRRPARDRPEVAERGHRRAGRSVRCDRHGRWLRRPGCRYRGLDRPRHLECHSDVTADRARRLRTAPSPPSSRDRPGRCLSGRGSVPSSLRAGPRRRTEARR